MQVNITPYYLDDVLGLRDTWMAFTIILAIIFFVILCIFIFLRQVASHLMLTLKKIK